MNHHKDAGRRIAHIGYDRLNNPVRIQFTNGNVTKYIYSAAGEKLRVTHQTAVPNITVPIGSVRELAPSEILSTDSTDYLLGGSLTLRNGRIDKLQFEEGYCQAERYAGNSSQDDFYLYYYDRDHLSNIRHVVKADRTTNGTVVQTMDYYPFGAQFCHSSTASEVQSRKYNGKELDKMHGLDTYDYGARQYNPILGRWDRMDPLCEKYYDVSPYAYCGGNPMNRIDPDGREIWIYYNDENGQQQSFQYSVGMECPVNNDNAQTFVNNLNTMHTNESGAKVIDAIIESNTKYGYQQANTHSDGGGGYLHPKTNIVSLNDAGNTLSFAEETFHMFQSVNNQGGTTAVNEVEAKLFSAKMNYEIETWSITAPFQNKLAGCPESPYQDSMTKLFYFGYNHEDYKTAVNNFFSGSYNGSDYKNKPGYIIGTIKENPLIRDFLPVNEK